MNASLTNVSITGFAGAQILQNKVNPRTYDFLTKVYMPKLRIDGKYSLLGRILVIPLRGQGSCWFDASEFFILILLDKWIIFCTLTYLIVFFFVLTIYFANIYICNL